MMTLVDSGDRHFDWICRWHFQQRVMRFSWTSSPSYFAGWCGELPILRLSRTIGTASRRALGLRGARGKMTSNQGGAWGASRSSWINLGFRRLPCCQLGFARAASNSRRYERGLISPPAEVLLRIKEKFKVSVDWLLTGVKWISSMTEGWLKIAHGGSSSLGKSAEARIDYEIAKTSNHGTD